MHLFRFMNKMNSAIYSSAHLKSRNFLNLFSPVANSNLNALALIQSIKSLYPPQRNRNNMNSLTTLNYCQPIINKHPLLCQPSTFFTVQQTQVQKLFVEPTLFPTKKTAVPEQSNTAMEIELKREQEEPEDSTEMNLSKEFLKFSRKLSNLALAYLQENTGFSMSLLTFSARVSQTFFTLANLPCPKLEDLRSLQLNCLEKLWSRYKETISYSKNKKICIVKSNDWYQLYNLPVFVSAIKEILSGDQTDYPSINLQVVCLLEGLIESFARLLYYTNLILTFTAIEKDSSEKGEYLRNMKTIQNFLVLMANSELYKTYNHRSGKFATECCGKCKVCRSKAIPRDFELKLERGRAKSELMKTLVSITFPDLSGISDSTLLQAFNVVMAYF